jgi:hypothetical protein
VGIGRPELEGLSVTMGEPSVPLEDLRIRGDATASGKI